MSEIFESKIRRVGTSFGVLIPKEIISEDKLKEGDKVKITILKRNKQLLKETFGSAKGAKSFVRDHKDRIF